MGKVYFKNRKINESISDQTLGFGKVESPSKYSGKTLDTPKVLGKIELPKEDEKRTQRRNKFVRGVQESYDDNYADPDVTIDYNSSQPYSNYIEERYRLKGIDDCLNNYDIESLALLIMEAIEDGKFDDSNETPLQIYNKLIKDIPSRIKYLYESTLRSCNLGKEWVRDSWDVHNK